MRSAELEQLVEVRRDDERGAAAAARSPDQLAHGRVVLRSRP